MHLKNTIVLAICCVFAVAAATSALAQSYNITFTLENMSNTTVDGVYSGLELEPQELSSDLSLLMGSIDTIVSFDGGGAPVSISFVGADITFSNWIDGELAPSIGGAPGNAGANVGLGNDAGLLDLALRNMILDITSDQPISLTGAQINQEDLIYTILQGQLDTRMNNIGSSSDLSGFSLTLDSPPMGTLIEIGDQLELVLPCRLTLDTSDISGVAGDYLFFNGTIATSAAVPVPEPSSMLLMLLGGLSLVMIRQRRRG